MEPISLTLFFVFRISRHILLPFILCLHSFYLRRAADTAFLALPSGDQGAV